jgi:putative membrane protein
MIRLAIKYMSIVLTIYLLSKIIDTVYIGDFSSLLVMGLILLIVNLLIKPLLLLLTLPLSLITLGLFNFIVNAWTIMIADRFVSEVSMGGFLNSLLAAFIIVILQHLFREANNDSYRRKIDSKINR